MTTKENYNVKILTESDCALGCCAKNETSTFDFHFSIHPGCASGHLVNSRSLIRKTNTYDLWPWFAMSGMYIISLSINKHNSGSLKNRPLPVISSVCSQGHLYKIQQVCRQQLRFEGRLQANLERKLTVTPLAHTDMAKHGSAMPSPANFLISGCGVSRGLLLSYDSAATALEGWLRLFPDEKAWWCAQRVYTLIFPSLVLPTWVLGSIHQYISQQFVDLFLGQSHLSTILEFMALLCNNKIQQRSLALAWQLSPKVFRRVKRQACHAILQFAASTSDLAHWLSLRSGLPWNQTK